MRAPAARRSSGCRGVGGTYSGELGQTTGFSFFVRAVAGNRIVAGHYDDAPDVGVWSYRLDGASTLTLTAGDPIASKARAGKRFSAFITVYRSDGAQAEVTYGDVACSAMAAGRSLRATAAPPMVRPPGAPGASRSAREDASCTQR